MSLHPDRCSSVDFSGDIAPEGQCWQGRKRTASGPRKDRESRTALVLHFLFSCIQSLASCFRCPSALYPRPLFCYWHTASPPCPGGAYDIFVALSITHTTKMSCIAGRIQLLLRTIFFTLL